MIAAVAEPKAPTVNRTASILPKALRPLVELQLSKEEVSEICEQVVTRRKSRLQWEEEKRNWHNMDRRTMSGHEVGRTVNGMELDGWLGLTEQVPAWIDFVQDTVWDGYPVYSDAEATRFLKRFIHARPDMLSDETSMRLLNQFVLSDLESLRRVVRKSPTSAEILDRACALYASNPDTRAEAPEWVALRNLAKQEQAACSEGSPLWFAMEAILDAASRNCRMADDIWRSATRAAVGGQKIPQSVQRFRRLENRLIEAILKGHRLQKSRPAKKSAKLYLIPSAA